MIQFIIGAGILAAAALLVKGFSNDPDLDQIDRNDISDYYMRDEPEYASLGSLKTAITRAMNVIVRDHGEFKIGKTGAPNKRIVSHRKFELMYLLCKSKDGNLIEKLEDHYIQMFIDDPMNRNQRNGSAGKATKANGFYYLYVAVNEK
jgi:hypothetical protein